MNPTETRILRRQDSADSWSRLVACIAGLTGWCADSPVYTCSETLGGCRLALCGFADLRDPSDETPFEGRIFDSGAEARWRRGEDARWQVWVTSECDPRASAAGNAALPDVPGCEPAIRTDRRYYLLGIRDARQQDEFHEARYPGTRFIYPVTAADADDRAWIEVAEYRRAEPDWSAIDDAAAERLLALPLLFAHRFVGVAAGKDR